MTFTLEFYISNIRKSISTSQQIRLDCKKQGCPEKNKIPLVVDEAAARSPRRVCRPELTARSRLISQQADPRADPRGWILISRRTVRRPRARILRLTRISPHSRARWSLSGAELSARTHRGGVSPRRVARRQKHAAVGVELAALPAGDGIRESPELTLIKLVGEGNEMVHV